MKRPIQIIFLICLFLNCSNDENVYNDSIIGEWKLMKAYSYGPDPITGQFSTETKSYYLSNITYLFNLDGTVIVSGGDNIGYPNGEYLYTFGEDYLGSDDSGPFIKLVNISGFKWVYGYKNGIMTLGQSYVDGSDLVFRRK